MQLNILKKLLFLFIFRFLIRDLLNAGPCFKEILKI